MTSVLNFTLVTLWCTYMQDFWNRILADPRGESVDKGNMKLAFESVSEPHDTTSSFE